jgi:DNA repair protein RecO
MSHHIYTTLGIVLKTYSSKEADKNLAIFTRDLGLVYTTARGVRKHGSKLSPSLGDLNVVKVSLVRGKRSWRLTTITLILETVPALRTRRESLLSIFRIANLLTRLIRGEDKNVELFDELKNSIEALIKSDFEESTLPDWELMTVAKLLSHLGYLSKESVPEGILEVRAERRKFLVFVNDGIRASGLD